MTFTALPGYDWVSECVLQFETQPQSCSWVFVTEVFQDKHWSVSSPLIPSVENHSWPVGSSDILLYADLFFFMLMYEQFPLRITIVREAVRLVSDQWERAASIITLLHMAWCGSDEWWACSSLPEAFKLNRLWSASACWIWPRGARA